MPLSKVYLANYYLSYQDIRTSDGLRFRKIDVAVSVTNTKILKKFRHFLDRIRVDHRSSSTKLTVNQGYTISDLKIVCIC